MAVTNNGFELTFQENKNPHYLFNFHFKNNKQVGVSIDG
ncbi:MAG: hypothetical protein ACJARX_001465 [Psychroserpens sp.]|jgi:hypothetical protein